MLGLEDLVAPFPVTDFIDRFMGTRALLIPGPPEKLAGLLSWEDINYMIRYTRLDGIWANILDDKESKRTHNAVEFNQLLRRGATLVLNSVNQKDQVIDAIARQLSSDLNMPVMNGLELLKALRELPATKRTPVLMLTTETKDELKQQGKALGLTGWIVKPFNPTQLKSAITRVLRLPA